MGSWIPCDPCCNPPSCPILSPSPFEEDWADLNDWRKIYPDGGGENEIAAVGNKLELRQPPSGTGYHGAAVCYGIGDESEAGLIVEFESTLYREDPVDPESPTGNPTATVGCGIWALYDGGGPNDTQPGPEFNPGAIQPMLTAWIRRPDVLFPGVDHYHWAGYPQLGTPPDPSILKLRLETIGGSFWVAQSFYNGVLVGTSPPFQWQKPSTVTGLDFCCFASNGLLPITSELIGHHSDTSIAITYP